MGQSRNKSIIIWYYRFSRWRRILTRCRQAEYLCFEVWDGWLKILLLAASIILYIFRKNVMLIMLSRKLIESLITNNLSPMITKWLMKKLRKNLSLINHQNLSQSPKNTILSLVLVPCQNLLRILRLLTLGQKLLRILQLLWVNTTPNNT